MALEKNERQGEEKPKRLPIRDSFERSKLEEISPFQIRDKLGSLENQEKKRMKLGRRNGSPTRLSLRSNPPLFFPSQVHP